MFKKSIIYVIFALTSMAPTATYAAKSLYVIATAENIKYAKMTNTHTATAQIPKPNLQFDRGTFQQQPKQEIKNQLSAELGNASLAFMGLFCVVARAKRRRV